MGGEHAQIYTDAFTAPGSSPHGRGTQPTSAWAFVWKRIIPAWAGNTYQGGSAHPRSTDHPRMGGEHDGHAERVADAVGSSPHGRGTRANWLWRPQRPRIIPAWAGNTPSQRVAATLTSDHPRMGGEHRGVAAHRQVAAGSSPHGRGTLHRHHPRGASRPDHPRMGGEHGNRQTCYDRQFGSSPHGRGTLRMSCHFWPPLRIIPAWAGNTYQNSPQACPDPDHPRMGGEHNSSTGNFKAPIGSSPHGRGTLNLRPPWRRAIRIIPAWAGNTRPASNDRAWTTDHPRMGGEHGARKRSQQVSHGSSPHGRGTRVDAKASYTA